MTTAEREYTTMDKSTWDRGAWDDEPDKIQWVDPDTGYDCLIVRNSLGALCGYVGLPPEHPCHGVDYDRVRRPEPDEHGYAYIDVHGGLTYDGLCQEKAPEAEGICHVALDGRPDKVWWLGFDCAHGFDIVPASEARSRERGWPPIRMGGEAYRTVGYVRRECQRLAAQLVTAYAQPPEPDDEDLMSLDSKAGACDERTQRQGSRSHDDRVPGQPSRARQSRPGRRLPDHPY